MLVYQSEDGKCLDPLYQKIAKATGTLVSTLKKNKGVGGKISKERINIPSDLPTKPSPHAFHEMSFHSLISRKMAHSISTGLRVIQNVLEIGGT